MAVHTILKKNEISNILEKYNLGNLIKYSGINEGIENTNYYIKTTKSNFILTIYENRIKEDELPFYLNLMSYSYENGINCPVVINNKLNKKIFNYNKKKCALFSFLSGKCLTSWTENNCFDVGNSLAEFHLVNANFSEKKKNHYSLAGWKKLLDQCKEKMNEIIVDSNQVVTNEIIFLEKNWPTNLPSGIIHADLFPDNVLFYKNKISGIIDFYFSCYDLFIYDLAILINAWCFVENDFKKNNFISVIKGYEEKRVLTMSEKKSLNICLRGASIRFLMTRTYDKIYKNSFNEKDPNDYLKRLNFHKSVNLFEGYFE